MNPELRGYHLGKGKTVLLIPKGKEKRFKENFKKLYSKWEKQAKTGLHVVKKGESLSTIAKKYKMPLSLLVKRNQLTLKSMIHPGDRLIVESGKRF